MKTKQFITSSCLAALLIGPVVTNIATAGTSTAAPAAVTTGTIHATGAINPTFTLTKPGATSALTRFLERSGFSNSDIKTAIQTQPGITSVDFSALPGVSFNASQLYWAIPIPEGAIRYAITFQMQTNGAGNIRYQWTDGNSTEHGTAQQLMQAARSGKLQKIQMIIPAQSK